MGWRQEGHPAVKCAPIVRVKPCSSLEDGRSEEDVDSDIPDYAEQPVKVVDDGELAITSFHFCYVCNKGASILSFIDDTVVVSNID